MGDQAPKTPVTAPTTQASGVVAGLDLDAMLSGQSNVGDLKTLKSVWGTTLSEDAPVQRRGALTPPKFTPGGSVTAFENAQANPPRAPQSIKELLQGFFARAKSNPDDFRVFQEQLFRGGFYKANVDAREIQWGTVDDNTLDAFYAAMERTARYNDSGSDLTVDDVINERVANMSAPMEEYFLKSLNARNTSIGSGGGGGGGSGRMIALADPLAIMDALDTVAVGTVGRAATQDEQRMFVTMFHTMQSAAQSTTSGSYVTPDVGSQANAFMRQQAPLEAAGHDVANTMNMFMKIIKGVG